MKWELNPRRKPYNRRGGESGCILSQANTQKTAVKVRSPQRGAEGGLDSGIFPSPAPYKKADGSSVFFLYITKWELNPRRKPYNRRGANLGVPYHRQTPRKPLSRCVARSTAPKATLIAGYSLHLLHTKTDGSSVCFFDILFIEINSCSVRFQIANGRE